MTTHCPKCKAENPDESKFCNECGLQMDSIDQMPSPPTQTLEVPKQELTTGSTFAGRYQIIEELGRGGMGRVYKATDTKIKEKVALKLIKPEIASDKKTLERFSNELRIARKIVHKNVGRMYDINEEDGTHYITMEYVSGQDLKGFIRQSGQLAIGTAISITKQVCEGLSEAHKTKVIHRDLKPSNIMIDREGNVRIMDFGIARSLKEKGITGAGVMIGTPDYMSPEQAEAKELDQRSDIYSLGVILYEMVTGRVPFEGDTALSIAMKHKSEGPKDPKEYNAQIPDDLSNLILKCLEKDKDNRFQSAGEVRAELENIEKGIPTTDTVIQKRKTITSKEITVTFGLKKLLVPALVFIGIVIIGVIIWQLLPKKKEIPIALSGKPSLAVMYFKNNTGDESLNAWRTALSDLLITDLTQSKYIKVLSEDRLFSILRRLNLLEAKSYASEDLREVASQGRATHILLGNFTKAGDKFRINITLQEAITGEPLASESVEGVGEESFHTMVDELTRRIKVSFKLSPEEIASDTDWEVGDITTSIPEAYKFYVEGRKYHNSGEIHKSIKLLEKATEIDPEFAMAYRSMYWAFWILDNKTKARKSIQRAFELSERLPDSERYLIQGDFYTQSVKTYDKALEAYNKLIQLHPENRIGHISIGDIYRLIEEWDRAIESYEVLRKRKDGSALTYSALSSAYSKIGELYKAKEVLEDYARNFPQSDSPLLHRQIAIGYMNQGEYDLAQSEIDKAFRIDPNDIDNIAIRALFFLVNGNMSETEEELQNFKKEGMSTFYGRAEQFITNLHLLQGRFKEAITQAEELIKLTNKNDENLNEFMGRFNLAYINLTKGGFKKALEELEKAWDIAVELDYFFLSEYIMHLKGLVYLEMGSLNDSQRIADELKELIAKGMNRKIIRLHDHLKGMIELHHGNYSNAIESLKKALSMLPFSEDITLFEIPSNQQTMFHDSLAQAYYKAGDISNSIKEYERITSLTVGRLFYGDIYAKSFYRLALLYEQTGQNTKAIEHYEKFLELWKDADPGIAEVDDARERLARLKG